MKETGATNPRIASAGTDGTVQLFGLPTLQDLESGAHTAKLRLSAKSNPASKGTAARILQFTVN